MQSSDFEIAFAEHIVVDYCKVFGADIDPIQKALSCFGITKEDTVILASFLYKETFESVKSITDNILFADVLDTTFNIDYKSLEEIIKKAKADGKSLACLVVSNMFGQAADYYNIRRICRDNDIKLLEDCSFSIGGGVDLTGFGDYKMVGSYGDIAITYFKNNNLLNETNSGSCFMTDNIDYYEMIKDEPTLNDESHLALRENLAKLRGELSVRRKTPEGSLLLAINTVAQCYEDNLSGLHKSILTHPYLEKGILSSFGEYMIKLKDKGVRDGLLDFLKEKGIDVKVYLKEPFGKIEDSPSANRICDTSICLPINPYMTEEEIRKITDYILEFLL